MKDFEQFIINTKSVFFLNNKDHPSLWHGSKESIEEWEANPYNHPYTRGAYDAWKYLKGEKK